MPPSAPAATRSSTATSCSGSTGSNARRSLLLFKHKELLKKDMIKKQSLIKKELDVEIQKNISAELVLRKRGELSEKEEVKHRVEGRREKEEQKCAKLAAPTKKKPAKKEKLLCICRTPYDISKFYVGCDHCSNWFHGDCVGVTEEMTKTMEEYECPDCQRAADTQELYCLCKQPYDKSQFYVGCEYCSDWFHGDCVGVTEEMTKTMEDYVCSDCQRAADTPTSPDPSDSDAHDYLPITNDRVDVSTRESIP